MMTWLILVSITPEVLHFIPLSLFLPISPVRSKGYTKMWWPRREQRWASGLIVMVHRSLSNFKNHHHHRLVIQAYNDNPLSLPIGVGDDNTSYHHPFSSPRGETNYQRYGPRIPHHLEKEPNIEGTKLLKVKPNPDGACHQLGKQATSRGRLEDWHIYTRRSNRIW
jgi:hypothetical protein